MGDDRLVLKTEEGYDIWWPVATVSLPVLLSSAAEDGAMRRL